MTREEWLQTALVELRPLMKPAKLKLPKKVHVSVGFPSTGALRSSGRTVGECWSGEASADGTPHVFISPLEIEDGPRVLDILMHELIHAAGILGHRGDFARAARAVGLTGKPTSTVAGDGLKVSLNDLISKIGPYPHAALNHERRPSTKQATRLLKATCSDCEAIIRLTRKVIDNPGLPTCACGGEFEEEPK